MTKEQAIKIRDFAAGVLTDIFDQLALNDALIKIVEESGKW